ncbi:hypothetical protein [Vreelandella sp. TE19]
MNYKSLLVTIALIFSFNAEAATPQGDCTGTPDTAVIELPEPLSEWGEIVCTPYGHIISNREGWIWSEPAAYSPVFIPSQMVQTQPEPIGGASHFTKIEFLEMPTTNPEAQAAITELQSGLDAEPVEKAYRLAVTGSLNRSLVIYFINIGSTIWGIWCGSDGASCSSDSRFMVLEMRDGN